MIHKILITYAALLEEYLSRFHNRPEGLATAGLIGNSAEERPNKMVISLLNMERETAGGISSGVRRTEEGYARTQPPLLMNMDVMLAAVFDERQYGAVLEILSDTLRFLQSTPSFQADATPKDAFEVHVGLGDTMTGRHTGRHHAYHCTGGCGTSCRVYRNQLPTADAEELTEMKT